MLKPAGSCSTFLIKQYEAQASFALPLEGVPPGSLSWWLATASAGRRRPANTRSSLTRPASSLDYKLSMFKQLWTSTSAGSNMFQYLHQLRTILQHKMATHTHTHIYIYKYDNHSFCFHGTCDNDQRFCGLSKASTLLDIAGQCSVSLMIFDAFSLLFPLISHVLSLSNSYCRHPISTTLHPPPPSLLRS